MSELIKNKVAESGIITINPEDYLPNEEPVIFDLKDHLFMGMILKEKDFRSALKNTDWETYRDKDTLLLCSADAIIPVWAWMLAAAYLQPLARSVMMGDQQKARQEIILKNISGMDERAFAGKRIVIKGCGDKPVEDFVYMELTKKLLPVAQSIMYGEPCSTVPIFKKK
jgi:hypothetical protein